MSPSLGSLLLAALAGAGFGLLAWSGVAITLLSLRGQLVPRLEDVQVVCIAAGLILAMIGVVRALGTPTRPRRAWRTLTEWRDSWPAREAALSFLALWPALAAVAVMLWASPGELRAALLACTGLLLTATALAALAAGGMVHAAMKPVPAWRHPLVVPAFLLAPLVTGLALQFALMTGLLGDGGTSMMLLTLAVLGTLLAVLKGLYWYELSHPPRRRGVAPPIPARSVPVARNARYEQVRRVALPLRVASAALLSAAPLLALALLAAAVLSPLAALLLATAGQLGGHGLERLLFFADARQVAAAPST